MSAAAPASPTRYGRIRPPDDAWLAKAPAEPILEPDLPVIDTHHHLWVRPDHYYLLEDFLADVRTGHNVVATVFIECHSMYRAGGPEEMRPVGESEFVAGQAAMSASGQFGATRVAAGIVGFADLTLGDRVEPVLEAHVRASGGRFRGVRHSAAWDASDVIGNSATAPGPHVLMGSAFRQGLARLTGLGFAFDAWAFHPQHADIVDLARAFPNATIIVGHVGGPLGYGPYTGKRDEVYATWKAGVVDLARCPNVVMKLGGMMMRLAAYDYGTRPAPPSSAELADYWRPYIEPCIELFGADRCMFESNFPVDKMGIGWAPLWNAFKRIAARASAAEKLALFSGTARRAYRLD
ncbi:MAG TPA: amidohydrolase family protein [Candidatus Limnocylindrales bacterium]|nr:amidohydrolase family protein [Candidatus Limnocylindrales bacterium]